ncbi:hypothetical protein SAMN05444156_0601 [Verrucomicrobium sp. GAS474]|uniref:hypothetical protein n=1 Tax=Verrucomicrobium sp. GAS474 TaxID=1882831 RepID=UPI00087A840F|nr:hypothetical protein [Verrucomicrobium sp. GAS474]SDT90446.1 hypothetical protein SAMN05444156_0601 [Verrucomicrobium sp. GAS474]
MAKPPFSFKEALLAEAFFGVQNEKARWECYHFAIAVKPWLPVFEKEWGPLVSQHHLSNPDDPPDVLATFTTGNAGFEITELYPKGIRKFFAVVDKIPGSRDAFLTVPGLSGPNFPDERGNAFSDKEAIKDYALGAAASPGNETGGWVAVSGENAAWNDAMWAAFVRKATASGGKENAHIVIIVPPVLFWDTDALARDIERRMREEATRLPALILHREANSRSFSSYLLRQGQPMEKATEATAR